MSETPQPRGQYTLEYLERVSLSDDPKKSIPEGLKLSWEKCHRRKLCHTLSDTLSAKRRTFFIRCIIFPALCIIALVGGFAAGAAILCIVSFGAAMTWIAGKLSDGEKETVREAENFTRAFNDLLFLRSVDSDGRVRQSPEKAAAELRKMDEAQLIEMADSMLLEATTHVHTCDHKRSWAAHKGSDQAYLTTCPGYDPSEARALVRHVHATLFIFGLAEERLEPYYTRASLKLRKKASVS